MNSKSNPSSRRKKCCRCADWPANCVGFVFPLGEIRIAASDGCARCGFLAECVESYQEQWSHLGPRESGKVLIRLSRTIIPANDRSFHISLEWPRDVDGVSQVQIEIAAEVLYAHPKSIYLTNHMTKREPTVYPGPSSVLSDLLQTMLAAKTVYTQ